MPKLEGKPFQIRPSTRIKHLVHPDHKRVILWDNNVLGESHFPDVVQELKDLNAEADFNQGLDARLVTDEVALALRDLRVPTIRFAYDFVSMKAQVKDAIIRLKEVGYGLGDATYGLVIRFDLSRFKAVMRAIAYGVNNKTSKQRFASAWHIICPNLSTSHKLYKGY